MHLLIVNLLFADFFAIGYSKLDSYSSLFKQKDIASKTSQILFLTKHLSFLLRLDCFSPQT